MSRAMLVGVLHLAPLPGSPRSELSVDAIARAAAEDARVLAGEGYDAVVVENFGDAPFLPKVAPVTVSAMTVAALRVRDAAPNLALGLNVLRNDAEAAVSVATAVEARFIRVNVHVGARVTDQGLIQGEAGETLRLRRALGATGVAVWADVDVKHSAPLGDRPVEDEALDVVHRGLASAVLVTGQGTGRAVDEEKLARVKRAVGAVPVYVASGATVETLRSLSTSSDGVLVGTAIGYDGRAGNRVDPSRASSFARAFREAYSRA